MMINVKAHLWRESRGQKHMYSPVNVCKCEGRCMKIDCLGEKCRRIKITAHLRGGDTAGLSVDGWMGGGVWVKVTMLSLDERKWSLSCKGRHTQTTAAFTRTIMLHNQNKRKLSRKRLIRSWPGLKEVFDQIESGGSELWYYSHFSPVGINIFMTS